MPTSDPRIISISFPENNNTIVPTYCATASLSKSKLASVFERWRVPEPKLIINIIGSGPCSDQLSYSIKCSFRRGILKAAADSKAWIFTDGYETGISRQTSNGIQEYSHLSKGSTLVPLISFTSLRNLHNSSHLRKYGNSF